MKIRASTWAAALSGGATLAAILAYGGFARSADHLDSPATKLDGTVDINDLYAWMDGNNFVMALTVLPVAPVTGAKFSDKVQYVFHTQSGATFGTTSTDFNVICTFDTAQKIQCWAGTDEYVTGDASATTGLSSSDGKFKVFAGVRADPFFFNLSGFNNTVATIKSVAGSLTFDDAGCPQVSGATATVLRDQLSHNPDGGGVPLDFFGALNTLAIVVSIDKTLVNKGGKLVAAWASTNK